jgi:hypothetical protein
MLQISHIRLGPYVNGNKTIRRVSKPKIKASRVEQNEIFFNTSTRQNARQIKENIMKSE